MFMNELEGVHEHLELNAKHSEEKVCTLRQIPNGVQKFLIIIFLEQYFSFSFLIYLPFFSYPSVN